MSKMEVITNPDGGFTVFSPDPEYMRLAALKVGLRLEIRTNGALKLTRGPMCSTLARRLGYKGNRERQLAAIDSRLREIIAENND